jgi:DNA-binding beta-propeller fold protein YncE
MVQFPPMGMPHTRFDNAILMHSFSSMTHSFFRSFPALFLAALSLSPSIAMAQEVVAVGKNPESLTRGFDGNYFITLMGETRTEGDGNGSIAMMKGRNITPFCAGMDDPKGIVMIGDFLVTADFKRVWKVNRKGEKELLAGPEAFPHPPLFLNDVALAPDGKSVLVTDMGARDKIFDANMKLWAIDSAEGKAVPAAGRVYRITLDGKVSEVITTNAEMPCPNGVDVLDDGTVRVAEFFTGKLLERKGESWKVLAEGHRSADGIAHDSKGRIYVSEVLTGKVTRYEADGSGRTELGKDMISAADFLLDEKAGVLIVPDTKAGNLVFIGL